MKRFIPRCCQGSVIGFLVIILLVPLAQVENLVGERVGVRQTAAERVAMSWGGAQTTAGVLLAIPVETSRVVIEQSVAGRETQHTEVDRNVLYVLPDTLKVEASADLSTRAVGLYETPATARADYGHSQSRLCKPSAGRKAAKKWNEGGCWSSTPNHVRCEQSRPGGRRRKTAGFRRRLRGLGRHLGGGAGVALRENSRFRFA